MSAVPTLCYHKPENLSLILISYFKKISTVEFFLENLQIFFKI